jgi:hypothetical protein
MFAALESCAARHRSLYRAGVLLACAAFLAMAYGWPLLDRGIYTNDMQENLLWALRYRQPGLFPGDVWVEYQARLTAGAGMRLLYWLASFAFDVQITGALLAVALGALQLVAAYRIGRVASGGLRLGGVAALVLLMALRIGAFIDLWSAQQGGLPRGFFFPLLLWGAVATLERRALLLAATVLASALVYPPGFVMLALWTLLTGRRWRASKPRDLGVLGSAAALALAAILLHAQGGAAFGALLDWETARTLPAMGRDGPMPDVVAPTRLASIAAGHLGLGWPPLAIAAGCSVVWAVRRRACAGAGVALSLSLASALAFAAAYLLYFRLYTPSRFAQPHALAAWLLAALTAAELIGDAARSPRARSPAPRAWPAAAWSLGLACFLALAGLNAWRMHPGPRDAGHTGIYRATLPGPVLEAVKALPIDAVVAAPPELAGEVTFLGGRSAYLEPLGMFPFHDRIHALFRERARQQARGLFALRWEAVAAFAASTGVRYALVQGALFRAGYSPWARFYPELEAPPLAPGENFALQSPPPERVLARDRDLLLIDLSPPR